MTNLEVNVCNNDASRSDTAKFKLFLECIDNLTDPHRRATTTLLS